MTDEVLNPLFERMVLEGASDLHWCDGEQPCLRVHGYLRRLGFPSALEGRSFAELTERLIGRGNFTAFRASR